MTLRTMMATSLCRSLRLLFNVNACLDGADMFTRQASEALGRISHILDVKMDLDFEVGLQAQVFSTLQATSQIAFHSRPVGLDAPVEKDA